jgi:DNA-binding response OmpR family regulator
MIFTASSANVETSVPAEGSDLLMSQSPSLVGKRILVVEDREDARDVLRRSLEAYDYVVETAVDGEQAIALTLKREADLILLDVGLPRMNGFDVARDLRNRGVTAPIMMLTAHDTVHDKVEGLSAGADDYLTKPFDTAELLARVAALLRRAELRAGSTVMKVSDLTVDTVSREVRRGNAEISLTQKEYALLEYLMRHAGIPVSRDQISENVWRQDFDPGTNIVDVYINYLRKKIEPEGSSTVLHTVRGVGYMLKGD